MSITQYFRAHISFSSGDSIEWDEIFDALDPLLLEADATLMTGNPACYPYIEADFDKRYEAVNWETKVRNKIRTIGGTLDP